MTRAVKGGGASASSTTFSMSWRKQFNHTIEYVEISTGGTAVDFGDATVGRNYGAGCF